MNRLHRTVVIPALAAAVIALLGASRDLDLIGDRGVFTTIDDLPLFTRR